VPGFDGSEAYVLKEENEEAPPKTSVKTIIIIYSFT
jgi:hypothetical protein